MRNAYRISIRKLKEKRPLGRSRHRWEDNISMYLKEMGCVAVEWIHLDQQGPVVESCEHGNEPSGFIKGRKVLD